MLGFITRFPEIDLFLNYFNLTTSPVEHCRYEGQIPPTYRSKCVPLKLYSLWYCLSCQQQHCSHHGCLTTRRHQIYRFRRTSIKILLLIYKVNFCCFPFFLLLYFSPFALRNPRGCCTTPHHFWQARPHSSTLQCLLCAVTRWCDHANQMVRFVCFAWAYFLTM